MPVSSPKSGTITNFNSSAGTFTYTPNPGFSGTDTFQYVASATGPNTSARAATSKPATVTIAVSNSLPPVVGIQNVALTQPRKNEVAAVQVTFSGPVNSAQADAPSTYRLTTSGKGGSVSARAGRVIKTSSIVYSSVDNTVTLTLAKPLRLTKPLELIVEGTGLTGLLDTDGRYIDGANNGQPGSNAVIAITRKGVSF
jgi:hypothetical protein